MQFKVLGHPLQRYHYPEQWTLTELVTPLRVISCSLWSLGRHQGGHPVAILSSGNLLPFLFQPHLRTLSQNGPFQILFPDFSVEEHNHGETDSSTEERPRNWTCCPGFSQLSFSSCGKCIAPNKDHLPIHPFCLLILPKVGLHGLPLREP